MPAAATDTDPPLIFASDDEPGITRSGRSRPRYRHPNGRSVTDEQTLERITSLAIPPAWTDVWISRDPDAHLQSTGRDARGRKQARYHPRFRAEQEVHKFSQLVPFAEALPRLRRRVAGDLLEREPTATRQTALVVRLLDTTAARVGNEQYVRTNRTFGLSTLRRRQATVDGHTVSFSFVGKSGRKHRVALTDRRIARLVAACQDLPGQTLFSYLADDGSVHSVRSEHVNDYIRSTIGDDFSAKTFRTWTGTSVAAQFLARDPSPSKRGLLDAVGRTADQLGNTRAVCRASYVHPAIVGSYLDDALAEMWADGPHRSTTTMSAGERRTLHVLQTVARQQSVR